MRWWRTWTCRACGDHYCAGPADDLATLIGWHCAWFHHGHPVPGTYRVFGVAAH